MQYLTLLVTGALVYFYTLALILNRAAGVVFGVLVLLSLITIISRRCIDGRSFLQVTRQYWPLNLAMASPLIAVVANQLSTGNFSGRSIDLSLRLALFPLIFWALRFVPFKYIRCVQWAFITGAFLATIKIYALTEGAMVRYVTDFIPIIIFSELAMLLGSFSAFSIAWNLHDEKAKILVKLLAACAVMYGAYISGSRGTWITIPVFGVIAYVAAKDMKRKYKMLIAMVLIIALGLALQFGSIIRERVVNAQSDIQQYSRGTNIDTSLGIRFQLWRGSWILFKENPIFGVSADGYPKALNELAARKIISPTAATFQHSHNEILFMMCRFGLFGLLAILAIYFVPTYYFLREVHDNDKEVRAAASMGLALCLGILVLGLTDVVFLWWEVFPFYGISIALFLNYIVKRKEFVLQNMPHCESGMVHRFSRT